MKMSSFLPRAFLTVGAFWAVHAANTMHEIVSPLVSGPVVAQQLTDSNTAYVGTQVMSRVFNGSGSALLNMLLVAVIAAIWYGPAKNMFRTTEKV